MNQPAPNDPNLHQPAKVPRPSNSFPSNPLPQNPPHLPPATRKHAARTHHQIHLVDPPAPRPHHPPRHHPAGRIIAPLRHDLAPGILQRPSPHRIRIGTTRQTSGRLHHLGATPTATPPRPPPLQRQLKPISPPHGLQERLTRCSAKAHQSITLGVPRKRFRFGVCDGSGDHSSSGRVCEGFGAIPIREHGLSRLVFAGLHRLPLFVEYDVCFHWLRIGRLNQTLQHNVGATPRRG